MITYSELFQFVIMLCAVITLVVKLTQKKKRSVLVRCSTTFLVNYFTGG